MSIRRRVLIVFAAVQAMALILPAPVIAQVQSPGSVESGYRCVAEDQPGAAPLFAFINETQGTVRWEGPNPGAVRAARDAMVYPDQGPQPIAVDGARVIAPVSVGGQAVGLMTLYRDVRGMVISIWVTPDRASPFWTMTADTPATRRAVALAAAQLTETAKPVIRVKARCSRYPQPPPTAAAIVGYATAFIQPNTFQSLSVRHAIAPENLATLIPLREGEFGMTQLRCLDVSDAGRLEGCTPDRTEPSGYEAAAAALADQLWVQPDARPSVRGRVRFIIVHVRLQNTIESGSNGPCWPPGCVAVLPPPPPPNAARAR